MTLHQNVLTALEHRALRYQNSKSYEELEDERLMDEAIDEYIALHYRQKIKPLLNQTSASGQKVYTTQSATAYVKKELKQMYLRK